MGGGFKREKVFFWDGISFWSLFLVFVLCCWEVEIIIFSMFFGGLLIFVWLVV